MKQLLRRLGALLPIFFLFSACTSQPSSGMNDSLPVPDTGERDTASTQTTEQGLFQVSYQSELDPISINQIHAWTLHVETVEGEPVEDAVIVVDGGMPDHGHGLPTAPEVVKSSGSGDYRVEGLRYSMPGWWVMTFEITAGGQTDSVTFNLTLQ